MTWMKQFDLAPQTREAEGFLGPPKQCSPEHPIHHSDGEGLAPSIYQKPFHTNLYLTSASHHNLFNEEPVICTLTNTPRALSK
jgi:hypothetical protein